MWRFVKRPAYEPPGPVEEAHKGIDEFLLEYRLPAGVCDMNFRLPSADPEGDQRRAVGSLLAIGCLAVPTSLALKWIIAPLATNVQCLAVVYAVALLGGIRRFALPSHSGRGFCGRLERALPWLLGPPWLWLAVVATAWTGTRHGALLHLIFCGLPALCLAADRMATHNVYWMTANPGVGNAEMLSCRAAWDGRWSWIVPGRRGPRHAIGVTPALVAALRTYPLRTLMLAVGILLPIVVWTWVLPKAPSWIVNLEMLIAVGFGLSAVGGLSVSRRRQAIRVFWLCLVHWLQYGHGQPAVPWLFQSPLGPHGHRHLVAALGLILLAPGVLGLTEGCSVIPPDHLQLVRDFSDTTDPHISFPETATRWLVRVLLCVGAIVSVYVVGMFAAVGPILLRSHELLEE